MTWVEGQALDDYLLSGADRGDMRRAAETVVAALRSFYDVIGECYADFEPDNILITDDRICLLDPLTANPNFLPPAEDLRCAPSSADIGYWVEQGAAQALRQSAQKPRLARARIAFTRELVAAAVSAFAPDDEAAYRAEVLAVAEYHAKRYRRLIGRRWIIHRRCVPWIARLAVRAR
jgi:hypothetical protein